MGKPIIGITGYHVRAEEGHGGKLRGIEGQGFSVVGHDYIRAVEMTGGLPVGLPVTEADEAAQLVRTLDGLLLTGGEDVNPRRYGKYPDKRSSLLSPERDVFEMALIREALQQNKPLLCICRGLQLLNVYFGGSLYLDVADHGAETLTHQFARVPRWYPAHKVSLQSPLLRELYGADEIEVNSFHHQALKDLGTGLTVAAVASDGIVEALQHADYEKLLALQWHPEMMAVQADEGLIPFRWLVTQSQMASH